MNNSKQTEDTSLCKRVLLFRNGLSCSRITHVVVSIVILFTLIFSISLHAAANTDENSADSATIKIVATNFPEYDWVNNILGDNPAGAEVAFLFDNGVDPHSYQPTAADILNISSCDLFIYVGGESDEWVEDALEEAVNEDMIVVRLMDFLDGSLVEEEIVDGMQIRAAEEGQSDETEYDEHVWLSLKNAEVLTAGIANAIITADPEHEAEYLSNLYGYQSKLSTLDQEYENAVKHADKDTLIFADRFPFIYLVNDYGLNYYAAFAGCSAETEASFETVVFLIRKVNELEISCIMTIENPNLRISKTIIENALQGDMQVLTMDSMQATTMEDVINGVTYLSVMSDNLNVLKLALE